MIQEVLVLRSKQYLRRLNPRIVSSSRSSFLRSNRIIKSAQLNITMRKCTVWSEPALPFLIVELAPYCFVIVVWYLHHLESDINRKRSMVVHLAEFVLSMGVVTSLAYMAVACSCEMFA